MDVDSVVENSENVHLWMIDNTICNTTCGDGFFGSGKPIFELLIPSSENLLPF